MGGLIDGERRFKRYRIDSNIANSVTISSVECKVYEEGAEPDGEGNPVVIDNLPIEIINNGNRSVTIQALFDTLLDTVDANKTYKLRYTIIIGEEIYIKDRLISIEE